MTRAIRARLLVFVVMSAVGIAYVAGTYLGLVDRVLGRGFTVSVTLPTSGGLYEGSSATYRGVEIGRVEKMSVLPDGVRVDVAVEEGTELPLDSEVFVYNLSAVGEQYVDFQPPDGSGPYATDGTTYEGSEASLPVDEGDLLVDLDAFVRSVDRTDLRTAILELGATFEDTGEPLQVLLDEGGRFVREAREHQDATEVLIERARTVLGTQADEAGNIRAFSRDLATLTGALRDSDGDLRGVLEDGGPAARELDRLVRDLMPVLPVLLGTSDDLLTVVEPNLPGVEQTLRTLPVILANALTVNTGDGFGHVNLQYDYSVPPCTDGYLPASRWRTGDELEVTPIFPARCNSPAPFNMRGSKYTPAAPPVTRPKSQPTYAEGSPRSVSVDGEDVDVIDSADLAPLGDRGWEWLLVGTVQ